MSKFTENLAYLRIFKDLIDPIKVLNILLSQKI